MKVNLDVDVGKRKKKNGLLGSQMGEEKEQRKRLAVGCREREKEKS